MAWDMSAAGTLQVPLWSPGAETDLGGLGLRRCTAKQASRLVPRYQSCRVVVTCQHPTSMLGPHLSSCGRRVPGGSRHSRYSGSSQGCSRTRGHSLHYPPAHTHQHLGREEAGELQGCPRGWPTLCMGAEPHFHCVCTQLMSHPEVSAYSSRSPAPLSPTASLHTLQNHPCLHPGLPANLKALAQHSALGIPWDFPHWWAEHHVSMAKPSCPWSAL